MYVQVKLAVFSQAKKSPLSFSAPKADLKIPLFFFCFVFAIYLLTGAFKAGGVSINIYARAVLEFAPTRQQLEI